MCSAPGTWLLAILAGYNRYAHITALRADAVSPQILDMNKILSEYALRRALTHLSAEQSRGWLVPQLVGSVQAALNSKRSGNPSFASNGDGVIGRRLVQR
jgi:hypothetical protein